MNTLLILVFLLFASTGADALVIKDVQAASWDNQDPVTHRVFKEAQEQSATHREEERSSGDDQNMLPCDYSFIAPAADSLRSPGIVHTGFTSGSISSSNGIRAPPLQV